MSSEPTAKLPERENSQAEDDRTIDPKDLTYQGGYQGDPREIVENPAVAPQMLNVPGDLRETKWKIKLVFSNRGGL